jgi:hypothetical protein
MGKSVKRTELPPLDHILCILGFVYKRVMKLSFHSFEKFPLSACKAKYYPPYSVSQQTGTSEKRTKRRQILTLLVHFLR